MIKINIRIYDVTSQLLQLMQRCRYRRVHLPRDYCTSIEIELRTKITFILSFDISVSIKLTTYTRTNEKIQLYDVIGV